MTNNAEREVFEKWAYGEGYRDFDIDPLIFGTCYKKHQIDDLWRAWQARGQIKSIKYESTDYWQTPPKSASVPVERLETLQRYFIGDGYTEYDDKDGEYVKFDELAELIAEYKA